MTFGTLYKDNCAGCHGQNGRHGAARPLNDGLYLALIGEDRLRHVIANGVPGTTMPPFAQDQGGTLTDRQISVLADEMEKKWALPQEFDAAAMPAYEGATWQRGRRRRHVSPVLRWLSRPGWDRCLWTRRRIGG